MSQYKLLVKNLLTNVDHSIIRNVFETVGMCKVEIRGDQALVEYATDDMAKKAYLNLNHTNLLSVNQNNKVFIEVIGPQNVISGGGAPVEAPVITTTPNQMGAINPSDINAVKLGSNLLNKQALGDITATLNNSNLNSISASTEQSMSLEDKNLFYTPYYLSQPAKKSQKVSKLITAYFEYI